MLGTAQAHRDVASSAELPILAASSIAVVIVAAASQLRDACKDTKLGHFRISRMYAADKLILTQHPELYLM